MSLADIIENLCSDQALEPLKLTTKSKVSVEPALTTKAGLKEIKAVSSKDKACLEDTLTLSFSK